MLLLQKAGDLELGPGRLWTGSHITIETVAHLIGIWVEAQCLQYDKMTYDRANGPVAHPAKSYLIEAS